MKKDLKKSVKKILNIDTLRLVGSLNLYLFGKKQTIVYQYRFILSIMKNIKILNIEKNRIY